MNDITHEIIEILDGQGESYGVFTIQEMIEHVQKLEAERKRHELRVWDEMPDVEGWYFFRGSANVSYEAESLSEYYDTIVYVERNDFGEYYIDHCGNWHTKIISGTFYGPIPNPFEEAEA